MERKIVKTIVVLLIIAVMIIIFCFSNQPAIESKATSGGIIKAILNTLPITKNLSDAEKHELEESLQGFVRKTAHFSIYTVLGILLSIYTNLSNIKVLNKVLISLGIGIFYAIFDEIHQIFISGRSCELRDILIDSSGVLTGTLIVTIIVLIYKKVQLKRGEFYE